MQVHNHVQQGQLFGSFLQRRRQQLCMTCNEAANLAGLPISTWAAIESGWLPELEDNLVFALAGTLEVSADLIRLLGASH